jgi:hypothetical protein
MTKLLAYGATLARQMTRDQVCAYLVSAGCRKCFGIIQVYLVQSSRPNILTVDCWLDGIDPVRAMRAITIAERQLSKMHGVPVPTGAALPPETLAEVRAKAERLVDMCRQSRPNANRDLIRHAFDHTREACVEAIADELAVAIEKRTIGDDDWTDWPPAQEGSG